MSIFRPCIDLHNGLVKQIVGGKLTPDSAIVNHVSPNDAAYFASLYREKDLKGGHIISLGKDNQDQVFSALKTFPGGLQYGGGVTAKNAEAENPDKDIHLYINSPGGSVTSGMSIYDTMQFIKPDVSTMCIGQAASMGAFLLAAGAPEKRFCLPNSRTMIHQPSGGAQGQATDVQIQAEEMIKTKTRLNKLLAKHTGKTVKKITDDTERDTFMDAEESRIYGLVDGVLDKRPENG